MIRLQKRISFGQVLLSYFTTREWVFYNDNFAAMNYQMCEKDRKAFFQDVEHIDHDAYLKQLILGARQYCMKEDLSTLPAARRHVRRCVILSRNFLKCNLVPFLFRTFNCHGYISLI